MKKPYCRCKWIMFPGKLLGYEVVNSDWPTCISKWWIPTGRQHPPMLPSLIERAHGLPAAKGFRNRLISSLQRVMIDFPVRSNSVTLHCLSTQKSRSTQNLSWGVWSVRQISNLQSRSRKGCFRLSLPRVTSSILMQIFC